MAKHNEAAAVEWAVTWISTTDQWVEQQIIGTHFDYDDDMFELINGDDQVLLVPVNRLVSVIREDAKLATE